MLPMFFWAFVVGGLICVVGQLLFDVAKLTPGHTLSLLVVIGAVLDGFGLYEPLHRFCWSRCNGSDYELWEFSCSWGNTGSRTTWTSGCFDRNV